MRRLADNIEKKFATRPLLPMPMSLKLDASKVKVIHTHNLLYKYTPEISISLCDKKNSLVKIGRKFLTILSILYTCTCTMHAQVYAKQGYCKAYCANCTYPSYVNHDVWAKWVQIHIENRRKIHTSSRKFTNSQTLNSFHLPPTPQVQRPDSLWPLRGSCARRIRNAQLQLDGLKFVCQIWPNSLSNFKNFASNPSTLRTPLSLTLKLFVSFASYFFFLFT